MFLRQLPVLFWYLKMRVVLSLVSAWCPPNLHMTEKSPKMSCDTRKKPSPYSDDHVHLFVLFQPAWELNTMPCMSHTSTQGISSTGRPEMARHLRCTGCRFGYPPVSTVLSTFSNRMRYDGASVGFTSHSTLSVKQDLDGQKIIKQTKQRQEGGRISSF